MRVFFAWYDFWVGAYWDKAAKTLYVCPLPCIVLQLKFAGKIVDSNERTFEQWEEDIVNGKESW